MSVSNKNKIKIQADAEEKAIKRTKKWAQLAFDKAQEEQAKGNVDLAAQWMERTYRLTKNNPTVMFSLVMLRLSKGNRRGAHHLLVQLMKRFDFFEGWLTFASLLAAEGRLHEAAEKIGEALSKNAPEATRWNLAKNVVWQAGKTGCCAVSGASGEVWIAYNKTNSVTLFIDDQLIGTTQKEKFILPKNWKNRSLLRVESQGIPLIGSPINLALIRRTEGFVESKNNQLIGWLWFPREPNRVPVVYIYDQKERLQKKIEITEDAKSIVQQDTPLFRAKQFTIPLSDLPSGLIHLRDEYGKEIFGSPIDPTIEQRATAFTASLHTPRMKNKKNSQSEIINFSPISVNFKGSNPVVDLTSSLGTVIVIPIYQGRQITLDCIQSVLGTVSEEIIIQLVDDCTPEKDLAEDLDLLVQLGRVKLIRHKTNKGFPSAANSGIKAWPGYDIVLLNSDTWVSSGWIEELSQAAYSADDIGTVTPLSNEASILSYPYHDKTNPSPSHKAISHLMAYAKAVNSQQIIEIPTANGFCMFIRHDCLVQTGLFREDLFAQGYGEENDFCMRARHLGWRHIAALSVFVGHQGGVSFGNARNALMKRNLEILNRLHLGYHEMITDFIDQDPLFNARRRIDLKRWRYIEQRREKTGKTIKYVLLLGHLLRGGVERTVQEQVKKLRLHGYTPLILRPTIYGDGCKIEIPIKNNQLKDIEALFPNIIFRLPKEYRILLQFLKRLKIGYVEWHHMIGHHPLIRQLLQDLDVPYDIYIHDYVWFCPRIAMVGEQRSYCEEVNEKKCEHCIDIMGTETGEEISIAELIQRSKDELTQARQIFAPSKDTADRVQQHFLHLPKIHINPWEDDRPDLSLTQIATLSSDDSHSNHYQGGVNRPEGWARVCVIGAIGLEKGYEILKYLAQDAYDRNLPLDFVIVGRTSDDETLLKTNRVFITGEYKEDEGISLVKAQKPDIAFFPAVWPETWCYALSIAWRAGLMTAAYDLGAIGERIKRTKRGWLIPRTLGISKQNDMLMKLCRLINKQL